MALSFLLDENLPGRFVNAVQRHNQRGLDVLDVVRVGEPPDLDLGSADPTILLWCEREKRILVSRDKSTMPGHLANHLGRGAHSPGVFLVLSAASVPEVLDYLVLVAYASEAREWQDRIQFIP